MVLRLYNSVKLSNELKRSTPALPRGMHRLIAFFSAIHYVIDFTVVPPLVPHMRTTTCDRGRNILTVKFPL